MDHLPIEEDDASLLQDVLFDVRPQLGLELCCFFFQFFFEFLFPILTTLGLGELWFLKRQREP